MLFYLEAVIYECVLKYFNCNWIIGRMLRRDCINQPMVKRRWQKPILRHLIQGRNLVIYMVLLIFVFLVLFWK